MLTLLIVTDNVKSFGDKVFHKWYSGEEKFHNEYVDEMHGKASLLKQLTEWPAPI